MKVPFLDVRRLNLAIKPELDAAFADVLNSGQFILGEFLSRFEKDFAASIGVKHCIGVGNGLDALHIILKAFDIGEGDEVIVPSNTYIASWLAVTYAGATVVPVEPDDKTFNIDPARIEAAITPRTRAVMPVHLHGRAADMEPILQTAKKHGLRVIEDAAQAHGAKTKSGRRVGGVSDAAGWSFYPGKNLGALGDAGAVTTNDDAIADRVRLYRNYGSRRKYYNEVKGFNTRLDPVQASFLSRKLPLLEETNARRHEIASIYDSRINGSNGVVRPPLGKQGECSWHLYVIRHPQRAELQQHLAECGVETLIHYPIPPHLSDAYADAGFAPDAFPIAKKMAEQVLSLPIDSGMSDSDVEYVSESVNSFR